MTIFNIKNNRLPVITGLLTSLLILLFPAMASSADPQPDTIQAEFLSRPLELGHTLWLGSDPEKFQGIITPDQSNTPKGGVIILHDAAAHPDWPQVINPLRESLPLHGWATLSIQLPPLNTIDSYMAQQTQINTRIQQAAEHLNSLGIQNLVLIGHGTGAMAAISYLANQNSNSTIRGFIGVSIGVIDSANNNDNYIPTLIEKIKIPILDIYGSRDLSITTTTAAVRALAARRSSNNTNSTDEIDAYKKSGLSETANNSIKGYISYRQVVIEGADHEFSNHNETLTRRVQGWLERHANGTAITPKR